MTITDKSRTEMTDADLNAESFARRIENIARKIHEMGDAVNRYVKAARNLDTPGRTAFPALDIAARVNSEITWRVPNMNLDGLFIDAADVDDRYRQERSSQSD